MIKFLDLKAVNAPYEPEFKEQFNAFFNSGHYILGDQVQAFENEYAKYCGSHFCIGVGSGLEALQLIFEGYKILGKLQEGDEVIVPANTYIASVLAISNTGLKPVLVEPDIKTYNINPEQILNAITPKTKAVLGVHLYGRLYNAEALEQLCGANNLILIEDAAQAHGAIYKDLRKAGNLSDAAAFSFYPTKNLGALGDAGAITTNSEELAKLCFKLRNYGRSSTYKNDIKGYNTRLDELQAVFLRIKLKYLDADNNKRYQLASNYLLNITQECMILPEPDAFNSHVFHQFVIRCSKRDQLKSFLKEHGVETMIHYPEAIHKQLAFKEFRAQQLPVTEQLHNQILSLPLNPVLKMEQVSEISNIINSFS